MQKQDYDTMSTVDEGRHESKEVTKGWRLNEAIEEALKGPKDEDLKEWRSEILRVEEEGLFSEESSLL